MINIRAQILCIEYRTYGNAGWVKLVKGDEGLKGRIPECVRGTHHSARKRPVLEPVKFARVSCTNTQSAVSRILASTMGRRDVLSKKLYL